MLCIPPCDTSRHEPDRDRRVHHSKRYTGGHDQGDKIAAQVNKQYFFSKMQTNSCHFLRLVVKPCAPIKEADYKVTISTNKPAVSLLDLFPGNF